MNDLTVKFEREFPNRKIVIVGDLVADQFLRGTISRVSREAPVLILRHDQTETLAGGAGNAAVNVASLGGQAVLVGLTGKDATGENLVSVLQNAGVNGDFIVAGENFQTTTKVRVLAGQHYASRQQVIRIDYENQTKPGAETVEKLKQNVSEAIREADAIIISDYDYGVADREIFEICLQTSRDKEIPLLIDSRFRLREFSGATTATPNQEEVEQILGENFREEDCVELRRQLGLEALLITRGNKGMVLIEKDNPPREIEAVGSKEPVDVTGAGDTVIAAFALGLASGLNFYEAAKLANHAGSIVVMKKGTASAGLAELIESMEKEN